MFALYRNWSALKAKITFLNPLAGSKSSCCGLRRDYLQCNRQGTHSCFRTVPAVKNLGQTGAQALRASVMAFLSGRQPEGLPAKSLNCRSKWPMLI